MTAAVTFGKLLYLIYDMATSPMGDKINIPQKQYTDTHTDSQVCRYRAEETENIRTQYAIVFRWNHLTQQANN